MNILKIVLTVIIALILILNIYGSFVVAYESGEEPTTQRLKRILRRIFSGIISAGILWAGVFISGAVFAAWLRVLLLVLLSIVIIALVYTAIMYIIGEMG